LQLQQAELTGEGRGLGHKRGIVLDSSEP